MATPKTNPKDKEKTTRLQIIGLVFLLFALMSTSVVTALIASGSMSISPAEETPVNSMTDALQVCGKALRAEHGESMQTYTVDDLSSRAGGGDGGFQLYYELQMYRDSSHKTGVKTFYVNCFVTANGRIRRMDLYEQRQFIPKPIRRSHGNAFGM